MREPKNRFSFSILGGVAMGNNKNSKNKEENEREKKRENEKQKDERIEKVGQVTLDENAQNHKIHLLTIIGEIEGHDNLSGNAKTTKYEHILPRLAAIEDSGEVDGVLILLNTMGGDVEAGLAIAEMIASLSNRRCPWCLAGAIPLVCPLP